MDPSCQVQRADDTPDAGQFGGFAPANATFL